MERGFQSIIKCQIKLDDQGKQLKPSVAMQKVLIIRHQSWKMWQTLAEKTPPGQFLPYVVFHHHILIIHHLIYTSQILICLYKSYSSLSYFHLSPFILFPHLRQQGATETKIRTQLWRNITVYTSGTMNC